MAHDFAFVPRLNGLVGLFVDWMPSFDEAFVFFFFFASVSRFGILERNVNLYLNVAVGTFVANYTINVWKSGNEFY